MNLFHHNSIESSGQSACEFSTSPTDFLLFYTNFPNAMYSALQIGLEGSGSPTDFLLAVVILFGAFVVVFLIGRLFDGIF